MNTTQTIVTALDPQAFSKAVAALNRRAKRLKVPEIEFKHIRTFKTERSHTTAIVDGHELVNEETAAWKVDVHEYELTHLAIIQEGWTLCARITPTDGMETFVETFPNCPDGFDRAKWEKADIGNCDHCHTNRRRGVSYVLHHEAKGLKQVGSNCMEELTGGVTAAVFEFIAHTFSLFRDWECMDFEEGMGGGRGEYFYSPRFIVATVLALSEHGGGFKATLRDDYGNVLVPGTNLIAKDMVRDSSLASKAGIRPGLFFDAAEAVLEGVLDLDDDGSEFMADLQYCAAKRGVPANKIGLVGYAPKALENAKSRAIADAISAKSEWVGKVKERLRGLVLTNLRNHSFESMYGTCHIQTFYDADSNIYVWKSSNGVDCQPGDVVTLTGTVKEHSEYKGTKQTVLTRCKVDEKKA